MNKQNKMAGKAGFKLLAALVSLIFSEAVFAQQQQQPVINDITQLNPIYVSEVIAPVSVQEIINAVKAQQGPVSVGGGRYSMGGQTATENSLHLDMRKFDQVVDFSAERKEITVQTGITWRKLQEFIDPFNLSVKIMQTYANFTVGGSLSVNVHGRYIGQGPLILSVKQIKIVLATGELVTASPAVNKELFYGAIGGYGGLGVITEATLMLSENCKVMRSDKVMPIRKYSAFFSNQVKTDTTVIFHNADIYPNRYKKVRAVTYQTTQKPVTISHRLKPVEKDYKLNRAAFSFISEAPAGKWVRQHLIDPLQYIGNPVVWRNYEASYDVLELEPKSRKKSTYVLQEYFVPVNQFNAFYPVLTQILKANKVNAINISIRHAKQDPGSVLAWARTEVFAFVLYFKQGTKYEDKEEVRQWTQQLISAAVSCGGTYYLPYQIFATPGQFKAAYPAFSDFFTLKKQYDPANKFRNKLWDAYYKPE